MPDSGMEKMIIDELLNIDGGLKYFYVGDRPQKIHDNTQELIEIDRRLELSLKLEKPYLAWW